MNASLALNSCFSKASEAGKSANPNIIGDTEMLMNKDPIWNDQIQMADRSRKKDSPERIKRRAAAMREMIREAAEGMEAAGMVHVVHIPSDHVERRRIWASVPDRRSLTGRLLGDPIPERSARSSR